MKIWFDTEFFENGRIIDPISIGMIREDGKTLYFESMQATKICTRDPWLMTNVYPHLTGNRFSREHIANAILGFAGDKPEFWAYYAAYDWVLLCQYFGRMMELPKGWPMFCRDVKQLCMDKGNPKLPKQEVEHNALADAIWTKQSWDFLQK